MTHGRARSWLCSIVVIVSRYHLFRKEFFFVFVWQGLTWSFGLGRDPAEREGGKKVKNDSGRVEVWEENDGPGVGVSERGRPLDAC